MLAVDTYTAVCHFIRGREYSRRFVVQLSILNTTRLALLAVV